MLCFFCFENVIEQSPSGRRANGTRGSMHARLLQLNIQQRTVHRINMKSHTVINKHKIKQQKKHTKKLQKYKKS